MKIRSYRDVGGASVELHDAGKVPRGEDTTNVLTGVSSQVRQLPTALCCSLTWDRGIELARLNVCIWKFICIQNKHGHYIKHLACEE